MTKVDWLIVAFTALLAVYGYAQGFIVGILSLVGFGLGAFIGTRLAPLILPGGSHSQYAPLFGLLGALLAGAVLASGFEGIGARARMFLRLPGLRTADGVLGAALTAAVALGIAWIVGAIALQSSGSQALERDIQRSAILQGLNALLPPSGPILHVLARVDPLPSVRGPAADVPPPPREIIATRRVRAAGDSVVKVLGTACGLGIEGSGWVAEPGIVVTNAHVVAGETDTTVQLGGNPPGLDADVIDFDAHDDVAILRVPGLRRPALRLAAAPHAGTPAAILGYPLDGEFDLEPGRIGHTETVSTQDAYGTGSVLRSITALRGWVRPGNSGGPMVDRSGEVVATVFAAITGSPTGQGGFAVPNALVRKELAASSRRFHSVPTGQCAG
ncbi:MAG: MarP family serine protease [Solirubrobacterales bacterium]|nr:MarP family serine protease [Solirubrobacterales bacterium]MBV9364540.1 MarP family serine protease [Solirubrobacterales bacterium]MBV9810659.1 MarP family serine protease [Solirubrobacterales bacterium]